MPSLDDLSQFVLSGLTIGCIFALVALGFIVIAKVTGVFNFAQGDYVMLGGMVTAWADGASWSWIVAIPLAILAVSVVALVQERATVAPVRGKVGPLAIVVGTLGFGVVLRGLALLVWGKDPLRAASFTPGTFELLGARLDNQVLWVWAVTLAVLGGTVLLFRWTHVGRAMRASAINPTAARLLGIRIGPLSVVAFILAGAVSGLVGAATVPLTLVSWNSGVLVGLVGFIAAAMGGFTSPSKAVLAGLGLGMTETLSAGLISSSYRQAFVYGALLLFLFMRDVLGDGGVVRRMVRGQMLGVPRRVRVVPSRPPVAMGARTGRSKVETPKLVRRSRAGFRSRVPPAVLVGVAAIVPFAITGLGRDAAILILLTAVGATGLSLVMGLAGQLSLGQAAFYLVGGYSAAILSAKYGWNQILALAVAVGLSGLVAYGVGWLTLRLRGFNLAIATLAVHLILLVFVTQEESLTGGQLGTIGVPPFRVFGIALYDSFRFYYVSLAALLACLTIARNLWRSPIGLALRALGADEEGAEALGLRTFHLKVVVFAVAGAMGGLAGALWAYYIRFADPSIWDVQLTIALLTFVIVGGLTSVFGGAVGAVVVGALQHWIQQNPLSGPSSQEVEIILSGVLLILFILVFRDGLAGALRSERLGPAARWLRAARPSSAAASSAPDPSAALADDPMSLEPLGPPSIEAPSLDRKAPVPADAAADPLLVVSGLTKRFGGFKAVDGVDLALRPGTITAMVGPNGAGKSTLINLVAGALVPSGGRITLRGQRLDGLHANEVARLGLARTFQTPKAFGGLTAVETVMLARDRHSRTRLIDAILSTPRARREGEDARERAMAWLDFVGLRVSADLIATSLPVGHQRLLDVARALAAEPTVLLLDEPAAGLDHTETVALGKLVRGIAAMGVAVLLVEHDMGLVMSVADWIVVLDQGRKIAEGPPSVVGQDQRVIEAYLGVVHR